MKINKLRIFYGASDSVLRQCICLYETKRRTVWVTKGKKNTLLNRGFHVYQEIWTPVIGECLECRHEPRNVEDKNAIAVIKDETVIGHVPRCFSLWMKMILGLPKSNISCKITGNRVNRGAGNGLEIPCEYSAEGDRRTVNWLEKGASSEKILVKVSLALTQKEDRENVKQLTADSRIRLEIITEL